MLCRLRVPLLTHYRLQALTMACGCRWKGKAISFLVLKQLEPVLDAYLRARLHLTHPRCPYLLVGPHGKQVKEVGWSERFRSILRAWDAGFDFHPQRLRHIYVEDRMELSAAPGPRNEAAAMVSSAHPF